MNSSNLSGAAALKTLLGFLVTALAGVGAYYFFFTDRQAAPAPGVAPEGFAGASEITDPEIRDLAKDNDEFLRILASLKGISLESPLFSNNIFNERLLDSSFKLAPEPPCRRNPFAAIDIPDDYTCATLAPGDAEAEAPPPPAEEEPAS